MLNIIDLHSCLYHLVQTARFRAKDYLSRGVVLVWYKYEIHSPSQTACNDTKKVNLKNIENEIYFGSMTKTRDKPSFFIVTPHSSFISSLFLWPVLGSQIVGLGTSRKLYKPSEKKTRAISTGKRYYTAAVLVNKKHTETNSIGWLFFRSPYLTKPGCLATAARENRQSRVAIQWTARRYLEHPSENRAKNSNHASWAAMDSCSLHWHRILNFSSTKGVLNRDTCLVLVDTKIWIIHCRAIKDQTNDS